MMNLLVSRRIFNLSYLYGLRIPSPTDNLCGFTDSLNNMKANGEKHESSMDVRKHFVPVPLIFWLNLHGGTEGPPSNQAARQKLYLSEEFCSPKYIGARAMSSGNRGIH